MSRWILSAGCCACLALSQVAAPPATGSAPARTAAQIVAAHVAARGGADRFSAARSIHRTSASEYLATDAVWVRPDRYRLESRDLGGYVGDEVRTAVGNEGWVTRGGQNGALTGPEIQELRESVTVGWELLALDMLKATASVDGEELVDGRMADRLVVHLASGGRVQILIDRATNLEVLRRRHVTAPDGSAATITNRAGDHREVGGLRMPRSFAPASFVFSIDDDVPAAWFIRPGAPDWAPTGALPRRSTPGVVSR